MAETERNLRALGLFRDVGIDTIRVDGRLVVRVNTADAWTTTVQAEAKSTGGQLEWGLGLKEKNLLGTATLGRAKFRNKVDREEVTLEASQNRLFGTRIRVHSRFDLLSDGDNGDWTFGVPFRAFADRQSWELHGGFAQRRELQFRDGENCSGSFGTGCFCRTCGSPTLPWRTRPDSSGWAGSPK